MKKAKVFKQDDKVFAKVKGYPPWPACVVEVVGKKYKVEFYGTGEIGIITPENLFYFTKHKKQFVKTLKRREYNDALEQIEKAILNSNGDGAPSENISDEESIISDGKISPNTSESPLNTSSVSDKKVKRKRSISEKSTENQPLRKSSRSRSSVDKKEVAEEIVTQEEVIVEEEVNPLIIKKEVVPVIEKEVVQVIKKEKEFTPVEVKKEQVVKKKKVDDLLIKDPKIKVVSERYLNYCIKYGDYVKENESFFKPRPVEFREEYANQVLAVKLPAGNLIGIKLHQTWPISSENEFDRALHDSAAATQVLKLKEELLSEAKTIDENPELYIPDIKMTEESIQIALENDEIEKKKAKLTRLKVEANLVGIDAKIKNCLGLDRADPKEALVHLKQLIKVDCDELMLKKHAHVVEMVRRLKKYVGNTQEWNLAEAHLNMFQNDAAKVRVQAEKIYNKFKKIVHLPSNLPSTSFWDGFIEIVAEFRAQCKDMTEAQIYLLCEEPQSRYTFFDQLQEGEESKKEPEVPLVPYERFEKENSSGAANAEKTGSATESASEDIPPL